MDTPGTPGAVLEYQIHEQVVVFIAACGSQRNSDLKILSDKTGAKYPTTTAARICIFVQHIQKVLSKLDWR